MMLLNRLKCCFNFLIFCLKPSAKSIWSSRFVKFFEFLFVFVDMSQRCGLLRGQLFFRVFCESLSPSPPTHRLRWRIIPTLLACRCIFWIFVCLSSKLLRFVLYHCCDWLLHFRLFPGLEPEVFRTTGSPLWGAISPGDVAIELQLCCSAASEIVTARVSFSELIRSRAWTKLLKVACLNLNFVEGIFGLNGIQRVCSRSSLPLLRLRDGEQLQGNSDELCLGQLLVRLLLFLLRLQLNWADGVSSWTC